MHSLFWSVTTSMLRALPPEIAHDVAIWGLRRRLVPTWGLSLANGAVQSDLQADCRGVGILRHPIGLAAGFDKQAQCVSALERCGFAAIEVGTVTPLAQPGNPKPRLFRQKQVLSLVNRFGFNSVGIEAFLANLQRCRLPRESTVPVWINLGKNKETSPSHAIDDYENLMLAADGLNLPITVNLSSPNTPGLRDLASPEFIARLAKKCPSPQRLWLKFDPDMDKAALQSLVSAVASQGLAGVILSNTHRVEQPEPGGQSGHALTFLATRSLEWAYEVHRGALPMIASGGIFTGLDVFHRLQRGADFVQIYTSFVYEGPPVIARLLRELRQVMTQYGYKNVGELQQSAREHGKGIL